MTCNSAAGWWHRTPLGPQVAEGKHKNVFFTPSLEAMPANATANAAVTASDGAAGAQGWQGAYFGRDVTVQLLRLKHEAWRRLVTGGCVTEACAPMLPAAEAASAAELAAAAGDGDGDDGQVATGGNDV